MTRSSKILWIISLCIALIFGGVVGHLWNDVPDIKWNPELKLYEVLNLLLVFSIGVFVPFFLKKWIEDSRSVKSCVIDELRDALRMADEIRSLIDRCHTNGSIVGADKDAVLMLFDRSEEIIDSFDSQMQVSFPHAMNTTVRNVKDAHHEYKDMLTGGELMNSNFNQITVTFRKEHETACSSYKTKLKVAIQTVHRF